MCLNVISNLYVCSSDSGIDCCGDLRDDVVDPLDVVVELVDALVQARKEVVNAAALYS